MRISQQGVLFNLYFMVGLKGLMMDGLQKILEKIMEHTVNL